MKVLVIGGGGREHAICWGLSRSPSVTKVWATPGNPGIAKVAECVKPPSPDPEGYWAVAEAIGADLTVVGPEAPLVAGTADLFRSRGKLVVGPSAAAAQLEGSKIFAKRVMDRFGVPTAKFVTVETEPAALDALRSFGFPVVLKADGLAAGKGVIIVQNRQEAEAAIHGLLSGELVGKAGARLVIEEYLQGEEVSFIALSDGTDVLPLEPTQDHKAVFDADRGPNTGGMGAYCDSRILTADQTQQALDRVIKPVIDGLRADGTPFTGFLYAGLMMTSAGVKVLEFNVRLGDPESQALLHRMDGDFGAVLKAAAAGELRNAKFAWRQEPSVCVVMASAGYPSTPTTGDLIEGIECAERLGATVFHAGTKSGEDGLVTAGGRVLGVTASGKTLAAAIEHSYSAVSKIHFDGMHYRHDIGAKGLKRWSA